MRVLVVLGASGGHIFPALSIINTLKKDVSDLELAAIAIKQRLQKEILAGEENINLIWLKPALNLPSRFKLACISRIATVLKIFLNSFFILRRLKPDITIGFGGFASVPVIFQARLMDIPVIVQEQNVRPGLANRILFPFVNKIAIGFKESQLYINKRYSKKVVFTGNPLRSDIYKMDRKKALGWFDVEDKFTILVVGGSQWAHKINNVFLQSALFMKDKIDFQVIHISGNNDYESVYNEYTKAGINFRLYAFLKEINFAYNAADLVISRSGAGSISEISFLGLASILIPYPFAKRHQEKNAEVMSEEKAAIVIQEIDLTVERLSNTILKLKADPGVLESLCLNASGLAKKDASAEFVAQMKILAR